MLGHHCIVTLSEPGGPKPQELASTGIAGSLTLQDLASTAVEGAPSADPDGTRNLRTPSSGGDEETRDLRTPTSDDARDAPPPDDAKRDERATNTSAPSTPLRSDAPRAGNTVLLLFAGIGIGAVLFAIVLLVRGGDDTGSKPPALALVTNDAGSEGVRDNQVNPFATEELDASAAQPKADSREPRPTKVEEGPVEDIAKLDALAWLPEARKRAKALLPDPVAYIIRSYVTADGTTGGWSATYHFYSPRLIKRKDTKWCAARVQAGRHNVVVWPLKRCKTPARMPMPKCSGARLWQLAHEDGVEGERLELVWQVNEGVWRVQTRRGLQQTSFENDCTIKRLVPSLKDRGF